MNKIWRNLLFLSFVLVSLVFPTFAMANTYELKELGLELSIPSDYDVITQNTSLSNPIFNKLGVAGSELIKQFKNDNIYLNAIPTNNASEEIVITMTENIIDNFSLFSDTSLKVMASSLINEYKNYGINVLDYDIYQHSQAKFIRLYYEDKINVVNGLQYYTIYDGKAMNFTMRSYGGQITIKQEKTIKEIVDSIEYNNPPPVVESVEQVESTTYIDKDTGVKFSVPANWPEKELSKEREYIDVNFASTEEEGMTIMYGSTDLWSKMSASDKLGWNRSDFDNSIFTISDLEEFFGVDAEKISNVIHNGIEYFQVEYSISQEMYGSEFIIDMTQVSRFHNGWVYQFQFMGKCDNKYFPIFQALLNTVEYPNEVSIGTNSTYISDNNNIKNNMGIVVFFVLIILFIVLAIICTRKGKQTNAKQIFDEKISEKDYDVIDIKKCSNCSAELPLESQFCHKCGTKVY